MKLDTNADAYGRSAIIQATAATSCNVVGTNESSCSPSLQWYFAHVLKEVSNNPSSFLISSSCSDNSRCSVSSSSSACSLNKMCTATNTNSANANTNTNSASAGSNTLKKKQQQSQQQPPLSSFLFEILHDGAKSHMNRKTVETLRSSMAKRNSQSKGVDRWEVEQACSSLQQSQDLQLLFGDDDDQQQLSPRSAAAALQQQGFHKPTRLPSLILDDIMAAENLSQKAQAAGTGIATSTGIGGVVGKISLDDPMELPKRIPSIDREELKRVQREAMLSSNKQYNSDSMIFQKPERVPSFADSADSASSLPTPTTAAAAAAAIAEHPIAPIVDTPATTATPTTNNKNEKLTIASALANGPVRFFTGRGNKHASSNVSSEENEKRRKRRQERLNKRNGGGDNSKKDTSSTTAATSTSNANGRNRNVTQSPASAATTTTPAIYSNGRAGASPMNSPTSVSTSVFKAPTRLPSLIVESEEDLQEYLKKRDDTSGLSCPNNSRQAASQHQQPPQQQKRPSKSEESMPALVAASSQGTHSSRWGERDEGLHLHKTDVETVEIVDGKQQQQQPQPHASSNTGTTDSNRTNNSNSQDSSSDDDEQLREEKRDTFEEVMVLSPRRKPVYSTSPTRKKTNGRFLTRDSNVRNVGLVAPQRRSSSTSTSIMDIRQVCMDPSLLEDDFDDDYYEKEHTTLPPQVN